MNCVLKYEYEPSAYLPIISCIQGQFDLNFAREECLDGLYNATDWFSFNDVYILIDFMQYCTN